MMKAVLSISPIVRCAVNNLRRISRGKWSNLVAGNDMLRANWLGPTNYRSTVNKASTSKVKDWSEPIPSLLSNGPVSTWFLSLISNVQILRLICQPNHKSLHQNGLIEVGFSFCFKCYMKFQGQVPIPNILCIHSATGTIEQCLSA